MSFLSDFGHVYFNGGPDEECFNKHELMLGQYIPPLLRFHEVYTKHESFEEWIDWYLVSGSKKSLRTNPPVSPQRCEICGT
jgi:hypothetical protein